VAERLAPAVKGEIAQVLGRTLLVWRKRPKDSKIQLPKEA
jgi:RNA-binding protein YhbY